MASRREVTAAVAVRYQSSTRNEKESILNEFTQVTGFHRKHAIRVLNQEASKLGAVAGGLRRGRIYDQAVQQALIVVWEAADRICAKRLKQIIPVLVGSMERYGHLTLDPEVRERLLKMSAATIDRLLKAIREVSNTGRRKSTIRSVLRNSITVRTFSDWNDPAPGFFEMDFVAHCGKSVAGSHVHSLVLTDVASGWTEAAAMVVREQTLVTETVQAIRARLPFPMLGLDVDNDSAFINETMLTYCREQQLELTRSRAYRKNDQAWIEQKNGAVMRKMVGYGRLEGLGSAAILATLHDVARLYVNYFQPCFKLKSKTREGAKVVKKYHAPATPAERLLANDWVSAEGKQQIRDVFAGLDPVELLRRIRQAQRRLASLEVMSQAAPPTPAQPGTGAFVASLSIAWQDGEARPTHRKQRRGPRTWRTHVDDFREVWPTVERWLMDSPDTSAKELFLRLQKVRKWRRTVSARSTQNLAAAGKSLAQRDGAASCVRSQQPGCDRNEHFDDGFMTSTRGRNQRLAMEKTLRGKVLWTFPPRLEIPQGRRATHYWNGPPVVPQSDYLVWQEVHHGDRDTRY